MKKRVLCLTFAVLVFLLSTLSGCADSGGAKYPEKAATIQDPLIVEVFGDDWRPAPEPVQNNVAEPENPALTTTIDRETNLRDENLSMTSSMLTTAVIKNDRSLWMRGENEYGQLGIGTTETVSGFVKVLDDVRFVALDRNTSVAIRSDNSLWAWGSNRFGQFGDPDIGNDLYKQSYRIQTTPIKIMDDVSSVALMEANMAVIKTDGSLWISGTNDFGQLGIEKSYEKHPFGKVMDHVKQVRIGDGNVIAVKEDGSLWTWGVNYSGSIGNGVSGTECEYYESPVKVLENVREVVCAGFWGFQVTMALKNDDTLWVWGNDYYGQIGNGSASCGTDAWGRPAQTIPDRVLEQVANIYIDRTGNMSNSTVSLAVTENGKLYAWGVNHNGQVGNGTTTDVDTPYLIMEHVAAAALNGCYAAAVQEDGTLWLWGASSAEPRCVAEHVKNVYLARENDIYALLEDGYLYRYSSNQGTVTWTRVFD